MCACASVVRKIPNSKEIAQMENESSSPMVAPPHSNEWILLGVLGKAKIKLSAPM